MPTINVAILGASGYTGAEAIRLLLKHPSVKIAALTGESQAGKSVGEVYPHLAAADLPDLVTIEQVDFSAIQAVFACLPHATTQAVVKALPGHVKVIDVSADFRLRDVEEYAKWYGHAHQAPELQKEAVYGLSELAREQIKTARIVACPGCYPTSAQLPLLPLLKDKLIAPQSIIIDSKSGATGAGRAAKQATLFCEIDGGISAYGVANHRHTPEIEQELSKAYGAPIQVAFTPHLVPMNRGILSTIYVMLEKVKTVADLRKSLDKTYANEKFVSLLTEGLYPSTHQVRGTNFCQIAVFAGRVEGTAILVSAIDNLTKGASGQAVQNFNIMFGFEEALGLEETALFP